MRIRSSSAAAIVVALGLTVGLAEARTRGGAITLAQTPVPQTGSAQGVNTSNSLPGGNTPFGAKAAPGSTESPSSTVPSGAAQGVKNGTAADSTGMVPSGGAVPTTGSAQGTNVPNAKP